DFEQHEIPDASYRELQQIAHGISRLTLGGPQRAEVMSSDQQPCRGLHRLYIQRPADEGSTPDGERAAHRAIEDAVAISARLRRIAGVKMIGYRTRPAQGNALRQMRIGAQHRGAFGAIDHGIEMRHLTACMHTGIGAASGCDGDGVIEDPPQGLFHMLLDAVDASLLLLPASESDRKSTRLNSSHT